MLKSFLAPKLYEVFSRKSDSKIANVHHQNPAAPQNHNYWPNAHQPLRLLDIMYSNIYIQHHT